MQRKTNQPKLVKLDFTSQNITVSQLHKTQRGRKNCFIKEKKEKKNGQKLQQQAAKKKNEYGKDLALICAS